MAWDFSTDPEFQDKLDWVERFCQEKVEPLDYVFPHAVRWPDPVKAYVRELPGSGWERFLRWIETARPDQISR